MKAQNGYHRGDLRGELLAAGRAYVAAHGHATLSVRDLAKRVGVSPGAPYRHFPDRRAMLLALALEGFAELIARARTAAAADGDARRQLHLIARAFLDFAHEQPNLLELMYESELTRPELDRDIKEAQSSGYRLMRSTLRRLVPSEDDDVADVRLISLWSSLYGFSTMLNKGLLSDYMPTGLDTPDVIQITSTLAVNAALTAIAS